MPRLSLAMIVKNEEAALGHCLASVRGLADEIVVVDTGSADGTVAVAEAYGARIGGFPWQGDFAAARNESLRLCTGDWILQLDADEAVDALDHAAVRAALDQGPAAFRLLSRNYFREGSARLFDIPVVPNHASYTEGAGLPFYADLPMVRLFRRYPDLGYEGRIHETVERYFRDRNLLIGESPAVIHHFGKLDAAREEGKKRLYLDLAEQEAAAHPGDRDRLFNLLVQAHLAGQWERAVEAGLRFRKLATRLPYAATLTLAMACQELGRHQEAVPYLMEVLRAKPEHPLALCRLPLSLAALGRGEEARTYLARAITAAPGSLAPYVALWRIEEEAGRIAQARVALSQAITLQPGNPDLRQALIDCDLRNGMEARAAADALEALRALPGQGGGDWHHLAAGVLLRAGHLQPGKAVLDLGLAAFPGHAGLQALAAGLPRP